jgi:hypothetical protein|tara:strand:+ start:178 stop:642 length:465 start_codon:yes stop_codon:yes gene_type:complete
MGRHVKNPEITQGSAISIPTVATTGRPDGINGQILFNKTTSTIQAYVGSQWYNISSAAAEKTILVDKFQGDGSTTVFGAGSGNTLDGSTLATLTSTPTDATDMVIFVGGIYQIPATNYTYSGGQITFGSPIPANDGSSNGHIVTVIQNLQKLGE